MQYFIVIFWLLLTLIPALIFICRAVSFRRNFILKTITDMAINQKLFSTLTLQKVTSYIFKQSSPLKKQLIQDILQKNISSLQKHLHDPDLRKQLQLLFQNKNTFPKNSSPLYALLSANAFINEHQYDKAYQILSQINQNKPSSALAGLYLLTEAKLAYLEGDLLNSSSWINQAVPLFKKNKMFYEVAEAYLLLGKIYQSADFQDSAELIFRDALKIFEKLHCYDGCTQTLCSLGIITASQQRWEEARQFFNKATQFSLKLTNTSLFTKIQCYQALLDVCLNNHHNALSILNNIKINNNDIEILALYNDIYAQTHFALQNYPFAHQFAVKAHQLYTACNYQQSAQEISLLINKIENIK